MTPRRIFVFGSNLGGIHGKGSAKEAAAKHGAERGVGVGPTGNAYAIPTKATWRGPVLPLEEINDHVDEFLVYAANRRGLTFDVVRVGCGLAGYSDEQIAPLFADAPDNVVLPFGWRSIIADNAAPRIPEARPE